MTSCYDVFSTCVEAIRNGELIQSVSDRDKEFHFQNWFQNRLISANINFDEPGRNKYPDFTLVDFKEGYEIKGLATPGREKDYDSNSQVPAGRHNGREIFYVFGRYPSDISEYPKNEDSYREYPVMDLVICHGNFLNVDEEYRHKNKSVKGFGSYGDIMIRDRKMYVVPTPFSLTKGTTGVYTLIVPKNFTQDKRFQSVGDLIRTEVEEVIVGYHFDLRENTLISDKIKNKNAGRKHHFTAYRIKDQGGRPVSMRSQ